MKNRKNTTFNVFISWSTPPAKQIAELVKDLLEKIFCVNPDIIFFVSSSEDGGVDAGARFRNIIDDNLQKSKYGILILTKNNYSQPWMMFEAGALSKNVYTSRIVPILFRLNDDKNREIESPINTFQNIKYNQDDFLKLIYGIFKQKFGRGSLSKEQKDVFCKSLGALWSEFENSVNEILIKISNDLKVNKIANVADNVGFKDHFFHERETQLHKLMDNIEQNSSSRIVFFGGISTDIKSSAMKFISWLQTNTDSRLFICYEDEMVVKERKQEIKGGDVEKNKIDEVQTFIAELNNQSDLMIKPRIHCVKISKRLSGYITVNGTDMYFTPALHNRSTHTFTYKLLDTQRTLMLDYMISKIGVSTSDNECLLKEIDEIKQEIEKHQSEKNAKVEGGQSLESK